MGDNDHRPPPTGSIVCKVMQSGDESFFVIACITKEYPGPWTQYDVTLLHDSIVNDLTIEMIDFHHNWHVLHRP